MTKQLAVLAVLITVLAAPAWGVKRRAVAVSAQASQLEIEAKVCRPEAEGCFAVVWMAHGPLPVGTGLSAGILSTPTGVDEGIETLILSQAVPNGSGAGSTIFAGVPPAKWGSGCAAFTARVELAGKTPQSKTLIVSVGNWSLPCVAATKE